MRVRRGGVASLVVVEILWLFYYCVMDKLVVLVIFLKSMQRKYCFNFFDTPIISCVHCHIKISAINFGSAFTISIAVKDLSGHRVDTVF